MSLDLPLVARGKVREIYDAGNDRLLLVASDRISAYDHVLPTPIPDKGRVLTALSVWWFASTGPAVAPLFVALFVCSFFCLGNVALITGPIATESAPRGLISAAIGVVVGAGEIFGGGVAPAVLTSRCGR